MLEMLKDWAMTIAGIVIFGSICEVILPGGTFQKYVRLAIGLMLILTLISPVQQLLHMEWSPDYFTGDHVAAYQQRAEMEERQKKDVIRAYQQNLAQKMQVSIRARLGPIPAEVRCQVEESDPERFGTVTEVLVIVDAERNLDVTDQVEEILERDYGIGKKQITVRYLEEREG